MTTASTVSKEPLLPDNLVLQKNKARQLRVESPDRRKDRLRKLREWILKNRYLIHEAMYADFCKHGTEVDAIELFPVLSEIKNALANLGRWVSPKRVNTPFTLMGTTSYIQCEPRGVCLIIAPWNYPFLLCAGPLVSALAAGNVVVLKPSELTPQVSSLIMRMTAEVFDPSIVSCYQGGPDISQHLLRLPFDHIFFTGSPAVGKIVMKAAAENLTSVTLELGGKSPAIIMKDALLVDAAERTAVAKFVNNGQTCIAPDYVLVDETVEDEYVNLLIERITHLFGNGKTTFDKSPDYCRIVNAHHFSRLDTLLKEAVTAGAKIRFGGQLEAGSRFIQPTILSQVPSSSRIMNEEIFGPILPIITFKNLDDAIALVNQRPKPLALYIFSQNSQLQRKTLDETSSGGACINDCGVHFFQHNLPFGGVNNSGIGKSHGYSGFLDFSNQKAVLKQRNGFTTAKALYPPYNSRSEKVLGWIFKLLGRP